MPAAEKLPGASEGDISIENRQRMHGTTRGMCPQVGRMGPISEDGPGHYNLDWSEGPRGREAEAARTEVPSAPRSPDSERGKDEASEEHEGRTQTARREELAGDGKALSDIPALKPY